ncbi:MAG TPA: UDP-glucose 4-epimerase GalE [Verrucomicrobiae bacterium]|jgi:UDP-glucose 4-epimerase|nr:UDP-glucose 4-epimerase GalE [Verrucomicrobiae bacterium]
MRVLVTGGAGYVGSVSVERLIEAGHDIVILDDLTTGHRESVPAAVSFEVGSYGDADLIERLLERARVDAILHCAARSLVGESVRDPARYYRDNVAGGIVLLEAARRAGVGRIVFSSTAAVYGVPDATPIPEDAPLRPINTYGETKRTVEGALRFYGEAYGLRSVALRYFNVAGATERNGELHEPETHLIPNVLRAAETGAPITIFGADYPTPDGTCIRDYIHVADLADAHLAALEATAPGDPRTDAALVCNLGIGAGFSVRQVVDAASAVVGRPIPETTGSRRAGDPPVLVAAADRAREVLGWTATRPTLEEMIGSAWAWRRAHLDAEGARIG